MTTKMVSIYYPLFRGYEIVKTLNRAFNMHCRPNISPDSTGGPPIFSVFPQSPGSLT